MTRPVEQRIIFRADQRRQLTGKTLRRKEIKILFEAEPLIGGPLLSVCRDEEYFFQTAEVSLIGAKLRILWKDTDYFFAVGTFIKWWRYVQDS